MVFFKKLLLVIVSFIFILICFCMITDKTFAGPVSRNTDKIADNNYRVYSAPVNYKTPDGKFARIDVDAVTTTLDTLSRDKCVVKSKFDGDEVIFTPDEGKWSLKIRVGKITLIGKTETSLTAVPPHVKPGKPDRTVMDGGKFEVDTKANGSRFLIPATNKVTDFSISFILTPSKGMVIEQNGDNVLCKVGGKPVLALAQPKILDTDLKIIGQSISGNLDLVDFTLENKDGTWTYTKIPGTDFATAKLPADYWIDADVVYAANTCGKIEREAEEDWSVIRNATDGTEATPGPIDYTYIGAWWTTCRKIGRAGIEFDFSGLSAGTVTSATIHFYNTSVKANATGIFQKGTFTAPLTTADYDAMDGGIGGDAVTGSVNIIDADWVSAAFTDLDYLSDALGGTLKLILVDYTHDYMNVDSGTTDFYYAVYFAKADYEMYIDLAMESVPVGVIAPFIDLIQDVGYSLPNALNIINRGIVNGHQ